MASEVFEAPVPAEEEVEQVVAAAGIVEAQHDEAAWKSREPGFSRSCTDARTTPVLMHTTRRYTTG